MELERPHPPIFDNLSNRWQMLRRLARESHVIMEAAHNTLRAVPNGDDIAVEQHEAMKSAAFDRIRRTAQAAEEYARLEEMAINTRTAEILCEQGKPELARLAFK